MKIARSRCFLGFQTLLGGRVFLAAIMGAGFIFSSIAQAESASSSGESLSSGHAVNGFLVWADEVRLSTPVSGVLAAIPVQAGQAVDKGQVLFKLDRTPFNDRLAAAVAQHRGLVRAAAEAKRDAERAQQLYDRTVASDSERQDALIKQEQTDARLKETQATIDLRQWQRGHAEVIAPFPARVLSVDARVGETVSSEFQPPVLMRIARADQILARATLDVDAASRIHWGQTLAVTVQGATQEGKVVAITSVAGGDRGGQSYQMDVLLVAKSGWLAGLPARIELP
ncbi:efflux RND transporter periplasmic adaptor subunit [Halothiobacillus sp.]|uniref:efflux RND transporter periplasmic adaptor subunit n=1 Tax=Halothiobacillus sp. TaxID=1891311 RepID=UPI002AD212DD|nr:efflux RND transporter periplasmic adaptor subunit [Halothiobacillus sp.]